MSRTAMSAVSRLKLLNQSQLLLPPPTLQFRFTAACQTFSRKFLLPDQLHWTPQSCVLSSNVPVMPFHPLRWVLCNTQVQRPVAAFQHVTRPTLIAFHLAPTLRTDTVGPKGESAYRGVT
jgi:hypothetical protein